MFRKIMFLMLLNIFFLTHLEDNLLHLLVRRLELSDEDKHHLSGVIVGIFSIHKRNQISNSFQEGSKTLRRQIIVKNIY